MHCNTCNREMVPGILCYRTPCGYDITGAARDPLLVEREKTHGSFANTAQKAQALKQTLAFNELSRLEIHNESLDMIATKLARIICGQPMTKDHWLDIAGYAKLGAEACQLEPEPNLRPGSVTYVKS